MLEGVGMPKWILIENDKGYQIKEAISYLEALKVVLRRDHYKIDERNINSIINLLKEML